MKKINNELMALVDWFKAQPVSVAEGEIQASALAGDASFRRYYRVTGGKNSWIIMVDQGETQSIEAFIAIARYLLAQGICVPEVLAMDLSRGYVLLSDLGDELLLTILAVADKPTPYYQEAMQVLLKLQQDSGKKLPIYSAKLLADELALFNDWFLEKHLAIRLSATEQQQLTTIFDLLITMALVQPRVWVHRDYHARNLMIVGDGGIGVLDFQDAVCGPITYDLVSLLRDAYITWPETQVVAWVNYFYRQAVQQGALAQISEATFLHWFDWMGLQRHLKIMGIFSRLCYRDGKSAYLAELPRVAAYIIEVSERYSELTWLAERLPEWLNREK